MRTISQFSGSGQTDLAIRAEILPSDIHGSITDGNPYPDTQLSHPILATKFCRLWFGLTDDGHPLTIDLYDPTPGPLLVAGDGGSGKTLFLQSIAQSSVLIDHEDVQFAVLTPFPEEWTKLESLPGSMGIWPVFHSSARHFVSQMVSWAGVLPGSHQVILVLFDGLDLMTVSGCHIQDELRWLLTYGPRRHVWPVVTVNPARLLHLETWLDYFETRILGQVKRVQTARLLVKDPDVNLAGLSPKEQFGLSCPDRWINFRLPPGYQEVSPMGAL